jgi:hypothetical protein
MHTPMTPENRIAELEDALKEKEQMPPLPD